jgi:hypothetical protein
MTEVERFEMTLHPVEFEMYHSQRSRAAFAPPVSPFNDAKGAPDGAPFVLVAAFPLLRNAVRASA